MGCPLSWFSAPVRADSAAPQLSSGQAGLTTTTGTAAPLLLCMWFMLLHCMVLALMSTLLSVSAALLWPAGAAVRGVGAALCTVLALMFTGLRYSMGLCSALRGAAALHEADVALRPGVSVLHWAGAALLALSALCRAGIYTWHSTRWSPPASPSTFTPAFD